MKKIIFATGNPGKVKEIRMILADPDLEIVTMKEAGVTAEIVEDGKTFEENAIIKAKTVMELTGEMAMADDSGLVIDYLNGEPGIYSARYMGEDTSYDIKNQNLIDRVADAPADQRTARFSCSIALALPDGRIYTTSGDMEGTVAYKIEGENGFGYDPILYLPDYGCTSAQLTPEQKNEISHRGKALRRMKELMNQIEIM